MKKYPLFLLAFLVAVCILFLSSCSLDPAASISLSAAYPPF